MHSVRFKGLLNFYLHKLKVVCKLFFPSMIVHSDTCMHFIEIVKVVFNETKNSIETSQWSRRNTSKIYINGESAWTNSIMRQCK